MTRQHTEGPEPSQKATPAHPEDLAGNDESRAGRYAIKNTLGIGVLVVTCRGCNTEHHLEKTGSVYLARTHHAQDTVSLQLDCTKCHTPVIRRTIRTREWDAILATKAWEK